MPRKDDDVNKIRVGLIGGGGIADDHILGYRAHADRITVTAVADNVGETLARRSAELNAAPYADFGQMIREADIDAVDICLPHHLHRDAIVQAAQAGKHILCEKPLCITAGEALDVEAAVRDSGVTLMSAHNQLFLPAVAKARELLDRATLGTVYELRTTDCFRNEFDPANMGWRASARTSGGGELIDTGYHPTYLLLYLARAVPIAVTAMLSTHRLTFMEGEDSANVLVRFDNGAVGQLVTSWAYDPAASTERFSVVGELGAMRGDGTSLTVTLRSGEVAVYTFADVDTHVAEIGDFADCLINRRRPIHTEKEGLEALGIILAAYDSARTGSVAKVADRTDGSSA